MTGKNKAEGHREKGKLWKLHKKYVEGKRVLSTAVENDRFFPHQKRDKKRGKIGYTQSYPHYPQKNPQIPPLYIM